MKKYVGIDLGTTNSVICSFDGADTRVWKSPEQNDVTPSAIYVDRHGHRFYGRRAYEMAPMDEKNAATLFKRYLGTSMKYTFAVSQETLTPEECSAEILRLLFGYLPPEWQSDPDTATVITVPAAFNQMKKDATLQAATLARIGNVALLQEPVAAVMSVMKEKPLDGIFLVYDLGGGTFDISVAEHAGGQVNLLAQGGKEMCGGREWDRLLWREAVLPWLREHFHLPEDVERSPDFRRLRQLSYYACEQAKIELSMRPEACIQMDEMHIGQQDLDGQDIYLDVPITQSRLSQLIRPLLQTTVDISRATVQKAGVQSQDVQKIVFIGGPTVYPPLQQFVMNALAIREKGTANPMTAVAEGASIFAESIDWSSRQHNRIEKYQRAEEKDFEIRYEQRVSESTARVAVIHSRGEAFSVELFSETDGWISGRQSFQGKGIVKVPLKENGQHVFHISLYDSQGQAVSLSHETILISRVMASVNAIPSSHAIALKALERVGGKAVPVYLVRENEHLPKRGSISLRAGKRLVAGSGEALVFTLWEGEIADPIEDNRYIGIYRIPGSSFSSGVITVGAEIICEYEVSESGNLLLGVTIPSVGAVLAQQNFYSRFEGQLNLDDPSALMGSANQLEKRVSRLMSHSFNGELLNILVQIHAIQTNLNNEDPEVLQQSANDLLDCQRKAARYRQEHLKDVRLMELNGLIDLINDYRDEITEADQTLIDDMYDSARRAIDHNDETFDTIMKQFRVRSWRVLEHSDRFIQNQFEIRVSRPGDYSDAALFNQLKAQGRACIENKQFGKLKEIISALNRIEKPETNVDTDTMYEPVSVLKGS